VEDEKFAVCHNVTKINKASLPLEETNDSKSKILQFTGRCQLIVHISEKSVSYMKEETEKGRDIGRTSQYFVIFSLSMVRQSKYYVTASPTASLANFCQLLIIAVAVKAKKKIWCV